tara:strand:- start:138 stop:284 length:147 start_codon:yes stop_codon:yes gene_type:complete
MLVSTWLFVLLGGLSKAVGFGERNWGLFGAERKTGKALRREEKDCRHL